MENTSQKIRRRQAIEWLEANPTEKCCTAARIYDLKPASLRVAVARHKKSKSRVQPIHGGQNKVLSEAQSEAVIQYIRDQAESGLGATKQMIFAAICHLKAAEEPSKSPPSRRWFQLWLKAHPSLHTIKTKPIARDRVEIHDEKVVIEWFEKFRATLAKRKIRKGKNIHNFDESGI
jgi:hypothetical protein